MTTPAPAPGGLGRVFAGHDPRSLDYLAAPRLAARGAPVREDRYWPMPVGPYPLDQGNEPECTGYGLTHELALAPVQVGGLDAAYAHRRYLRNVETDRAAGRHFDGGATVLATMKAAKQDGLLTGYLWNRGLEETANAVASGGPVCVGTEWTEGMNAPEWDGLIRPTGASLGGHFWVLAARVWDHATHGPGFWAVNSWGRWGVGVRPLGLTTGCAFIRDADLDALLRADGESVLPADAVVGRVVPPVVHADTAPYFARAGSKVVHDNHRCIRRDVGFTRYEDAMRLGYRPCRLCRPRPRAG